MKKKICQVGWKRPSKCVDGLTARFVGVLFTLLLLWGGDARALEAEDWVLDNGLRVILVNEAKAPVVVTQVWYQVGGIDEKEGKTGLSHMLEHMMFRGTQSVPAGEYSRIIARNGGEDNASTSWDYTDYWSKLSSDQLDLALELEADRMHNLVLDPEKFRSENLVVREERRTRFESNPQGRFFEKFKQHLFQDHPYGRSVIGSMRDIVNYTVQDLEAWYYTHYTPDNAVLLVVGDVDFVRARALIHRYFGALPSGGGNKRVRLPKDQNVVGGRRLMEQDKEAMGSVLHVAWLVPSLTFGRTEDVYPLDVLAAVLGGGGSGRLYRRIVVEQKKAVSVQTQYGGTSLGPESFEISLEPRDGLPVAELEGAVLSELGAMMEEVVSELELQRAKNGLLADRIYAMDSVDHLAGMIGRLAINGLDWRAVVEHYPEKVQEVTGLQIRDVMRRYLSREKAVVGVLMP
ncbi:MAG: insulinase family protein [Magnetococcales bacterium]|nr:insulinase family protein [Magnetococcales bacterium]